MAGELPNIANWRGRLGVPYQGSKNQIAKKLISVLPPGRRFVDLFAGGCAMTHAAILSGKYERFLANDLHGFGLRLFRDAIAGKCNGRWREFVTRDDFHSRKSTDPLIALCWSFSNNGKDYLWGASIEQSKRAEHERRVNGEKSASQGTRQSEALERLQALELDFVDVAHEDGDIVYCDPPYQGTKQYFGGSFDSWRFWRWAASMQFPVFVSEYSCPDGFSPVFACQKCRLMDAKGSDGKVTERLFVQDRFAEQFRTELF